MSLFIRFCLLFCFTVSSVTFRQNTLSTILLNVIFFQYPYVNFNYAKKLLMLENLEACKKCGDYDL